MNSVIALPIIAASPTTAPAMPTIPDRRAVEAYAAWLHMERRILCLELWPHLGASADKFVWADNAGFDWHFSGRDGLRWDEGAQPSARAAAVLDLAGVDWRRASEDLGLHHEDTGLRPKLPADWPRVVDPVIALSERVVVASKAFEDCLPAISRAEDAMNRWEKRNAAPAEWQNSDDEGVVRNNVQRWERARTAWCARKRAAERQCGLTAALALEQQLSDALGAAMKEMNETQPISLRGVIAKARAIYAGPVDRVAWFALLNDLVAMFGTMPEDKIPDLMLA